MHRIIAIMNKTVSLTLIIPFDTHIAAKFHGLHIFRPFHFKRIAVFQPVIRYFHLITVPDLLFEHSVFIADTTAVNRIVQRGQGLDKAGCQTAEAAITKSRIRLLVFNDIYIQSHLIKNLRYLFVAAEIDQIISQGSAHEEFHRKIVNKFRVFFLISFLGSDPAVNDQILDCQRHCLKNLLFCRCIQCFTIQHF